jgi:hypothetical protein
LSNRNEQNNDSAFGCGSLTRRQSLVERRYSIQDENQEAVLLNQPEILQERSFLPPEEYLSPPELAHRHQSFVERRYAGQQQDSQRDNLMPPPPPLTRPRSFVEHGDAQQEQNQMQQPDLTSSHFFVGGGQQDQPNEQPTDLAGKLAARINNCRNNTIKTVSNELQRWEMLDDDTIGTTLPVMSDEPLRLDSDLTGQTIMVSRLA